MLLELEILNGEMTPNFDIYTDTYTVKVASDVTKLELKYKIEDNYEIKVYGNNDLKEGENIIYLEITNDKEQNIYTIYVNKESTEEVMFIDPNLYQDLNIVEEVPTYVAPLIGGSCFLIILILFSILFHKKRKKSN